MSLSCYNSVKRTEEQRKLGERPKCYLSYIDSVFLGDSSLSMSDMGDGPIDGSKNFMKKYKDLGDKYDDKTINVTFISFSDDAKWVYNGPAHKITNYIVEITGYNMLPKGTTRLYDTMIEAIEYQQYRVDRYYKTLSKEVKRLDPKISVNITLLTDGIDNSSNSDVEEMNELIVSHKNKYDATCFFIAANQDATSAGLQYGFNEQTILHMGTSEEDSIEAFNASINSCLRCASQECPDYTEVERNSCSTFLDTHYDDVPVVVHYTSEYDNYNGYDIIEDD